MEVEVVREGRAGILGIGAEDAIVRVTPLALATTAESEITKVAKDILERLLTLMGVDGSVVPQTQPPTESEEAGAPVAFNINGDDLGILIGRRGQTLACLQYIVRLIVGHQTKIWVPITIDIEEYKQRRYQALQAFARQIAEQVKTRGTSFKLEPMPANERRIIHLALADHPDVITESTGEGESRRVVILPREK